MTANFLSYVTGLLLSTHLVVHIKAVNMHAGFISFE